MMNARHLLFAVLFSSYIGAQVQLPILPKPVAFEEISIEKYTPKALIPNPSQPTNNLQKRIQRQNQQLMLEVEDYERQKKSKNKLDFNLPSHSNKNGTVFYRSAFLELSALNPDDYITKKALFEVENAFFEKKKKYSLFDQTISQSADFILEKMAELNYDTDNNVAKNLMLFRFFSDTLELKKKQLKHSPFSYDFEDYWGRKDWKKMFVSKLLRTASGQCNSLPKLYLILAEEIGAEAFLSFSPNHSYIKFTDGHENWYNVELTNGMFTTESFILQSGFIKAEAIQKGIYMQQMSKRQLLSQFFVELASGYIWKYGYDDFVYEVTQKALQLYPNSITANMVYANFLTTQFEHAAKMVGINPRDRKQLQNIHVYPELVEMLNMTNAQYTKLDELGHEHMTAKDYENWLNKLQEAKQKQDNELYKKVLYDNAKTKG